MSNERRNITSNSRGKVANLIEKHDLEGVGDELEAYWTADDDRRSLRKLATDFNKEILRSALDSHGVDTLAGEVDNIYELLTNDEITSGIRIQAENQLKNHGINVDQLRSDFVSRQAIHTYLKKHRGAKYKDAIDDDEIIDRRLNELQRLKSRLSAVTERALSLLGSSDHLTLGTFQVLVSVRVQCIDCGTQFDVTELFDRGGCNCDGS